MNTVIISWLLSALSYDEQNIGDYITALLPGFKYHFKSHDRGSHFYGVVTDDSEGRAWQVNRGTDGYDKFGNAKSWINDLKICTGDDGVHDGFQMLGDTVFDNFKKILENYDYLYITGHSQGAGVSPYVACLCAENLTIKHCQFDTFAVPPTGTPVFKKRVDDHLSSGKMSGCRYNTFADPITSFWIRKLFNGADVGEEFILPKIIRYQLGPANAINHSCAIYNASMITHFAMIGDHHYEDYKMFGEIARRIVN